MKKLGPVQRIVLVAVLFGAFVSVACLDEPSNSQPAYTNCRDSNGNGRFDKGECDDVGGVWKFLD